MKIFTTCCAFAKILAVSLFFCLPMVVTAQVIFTQNFDASTTLSTYVGTGANQFDFIGFVTGSSSSAYMTGNKLTLQRNTANLAFARTTDFSPSPSVLKITFKLSVPFGAAMPSGTAATFYVGSGLVANATTMSEAASNGSRHSSLGMTIAGTGMFYLRDLALFSNSPTYSGEQDITWYINNSGATVSYIGPNNVSTSLADDYADVWVGTTRVNFTNPTTMVSTNTIQAPTGGAGNALTDFKFLFGSANGNSAIAIDDIVITKDAGALPVTLTSFTANKTEAANQLTWATASEQNASHYTVERSLDAKNFAPIGKVAAQGKAATYNFTDDAPLSISYYRLRQIDVDGAETFSKIVSVSQDTKGRISITPNPTSDRVTINLNQNEVSNQTTTVVLSDMTGRQVLTHNTTSDAFPLDLSNLAKGMYVMTVKSNNAIYQEKIIRQ